MGQGTGQDAGPVTFPEQVGLALRAYRREHGLSQRAFAQLITVPQATVARLERSADRCSLATVCSVLARTGYALAVVDGDGVPVTEWDVTDLVARDRSGRRFPAHRTVWPVEPGRLGPVWWILHEYLGTGPCGPQPEWTTVQPFRYRCRGPSDLAPPGGEPPASPGS
ncbi:helix-turn-helix transcriptional regulator [uncultured Georgenia sp.]|uniref:helix-turn-helix domain-containing protein n=1 Tax=uncultured Georgenia sp. TaxID=378209 RepID=UPI0026065710|nr:helix-turn-helix transcriptional regulator [uncultured Georgenia sp.]HLV04118.1 helix-turn-helix transcriptional regulator [Actinomycetaceae bacterium]